MLEIINTNPGDAERRQQSQPSILNGKVDDPLYHRNVAGWKLQVAGCRLEVSRSRFTSSCFYRLSAIGYFIGPQSLSPASPFPRSAVKRKLFAATEQSPAFRPDTTCTLLSSCGPS